MSPRDMIRVVAQYVLLGSLLAIVGFPYFTNTGTGYETIFLAHSAIHAELCLVLAWGLIADEQRRSRRRVWCLLVVTAVVLAVTRLLAGKWTVERPWSSILLGIAGTVPAMMPISGWFLWYRYRTGRALGIAGEETELGRRFRLRNLFAITAACAFVALLLRQIVWTPEGWLAVPPNRDNGMLAVMQSLVVGLLVAPCATIVLRPNRWAAVYVIYFLAVVAVQPFLEVWAQSWFVRTMGIDVWQLLRDFEPYMVINNVTWYGPQVLPTVALFVLLRLAGGRLEDPR